MCDIVMNNSFSLRVCKTQSHLSDRIFGPDGDKLTVKSQMAACRYGAFNIVNNKYGPETADILSKLSAPGVLDVSISLSINPYPTGKLENAIKVAVWTKLGLQRPPPGPFAHIMAVIEGCYDDCPNPAFGYGNNWYSQFHGDHFRHFYMGMHKLGHNLNSGHSIRIVEGVPKEYGDGSCVMDKNTVENAGGFCYNPAKMHQLIMSNGLIHTGNWYDASRVETRTLGASRSMMRN